MLKHPESRREQYRVWLEKSPILSGALPENQFDIYRSGNRASIRRETCTDREEEIAAGITNYVLAPALNSFVLWVLQNAQKRGIRRLYFLARDGYFMYCCANFLCNKLNISIDCRYLYCSRYSLRIPSYHFDMEDAMDYICRGGIDVTRRKILERSGIGNEEQSEILDLLEYTQIADEAVPYAMLGSIREELKNCELFQKYVQEISRKALPALKQYLLQEGVLEGVSSALVDSGWVGSMQKTLGKILDRFGSHTELEGYYWGLYELPFDVKTENYHCYYFSPKRGLKEKVYFSNCLFEAIFSAPHGMTVGYEIREDRCIPIFEVFSQERKAFLLKTEKYLMQYTRRLAELLARECSAEKADGDILSSIDCARDLKIVKKLLAEFMGSPVKEEVQVYGKLRFSDDIMDHASKYVAESLNEKELRANHVVNKALHMLGIRHGYIKESPWYEGSAALHGRHAGYHRKQYAMYKCLLYIRQMYFKKRK